jgi:mannose-6-phosphate isomerase-like protein (cupin superfamily)
MGRIMKTISTLGALALAIAVPQIGAAQAQQASAPGQPQTIREPPSNFATRTDIDRFIGDPSQKPARIARDSILVRPILTQGDPLNPGDKAAILRFRKAVMLGMLLPGDATPLQPVTERQIIYIENGEGRLDDGTKTWELKKGYVALIPQGLAHRISSVGDKALTMVMLAWTPPTAPDASIRQEILVRDPSKQLWVEQGAHWVNLSKGPFNDVGERFLLVSMAPRTVAGQHSHSPETEEVWVKLTDGETWMQMGSELRPWPQNVGILAPTSGQTVHAAINTSDTVETWFYFAGNGAQRAPNAQQPPAPAGAPAPVSTLGNPAARPTNTALITESIVKSTVAPVPIRPPARPLT